MTIRFHAGVLVALVVLVCGEDSSRCANTTSKEDGQPRRVAEDYRTRVVGWYWWSMKDQFPISAVRFEDLTHIVYNPENELLVTPDGHLKLTGAIEAHLRELTSKAHSHGVKVLMMMSEPGADFNLMMANPKARATFISEVVDYVVKHNLDGVEFDWEGTSHKDSYDWNGAEGAIDRGNYSRIVKETRAALKPHKLLLSICGAAWPPCFVTPEAFEHLDFINIMSYRDFDHAVEGLKVWTDLGASNSLLNMGMANGTDRKQAARVARHVVKNNFGGLFLFQLNYDVKDDRSMLKAVGDELRALHGKSARKPKS